MGRQSRSGIADIRAASVFLQLGKRSLPGLHPGHPYPCRVVMTPRLNANEAQWQVSQEHATIKELIKPTSFPPVFLGATIACEEPRRQSRGRKWANRRRRKEESATASI
ncbi:hypothetical protein MRX96_030716 [Rhipicephalus microplus]